MDIIGSPKKVDFYLNGKGEMMENVGPFEEVATWSRKVSKEEQR